MDRQQINEMVGEAMEFSYKNPVLLNMLTLLSYYAESDFVVIFKVMAGPLAGRIIDEIIDGKRSAGSYIPVQEAVRRALQGRLQQLMENDESMDKDIKVWVHEGLSYMLNRDGGPIKIEDYDRIKRYLDNELYGYG
ncbi:MAG: hypothetical protein ACOY40_08675 [Bacillota bacterium]